ncbi:MAG TPA: hypothetical protein VHB20_08280, partial [Verrucomicrobiae bacterium]|nr:hypothetical protein [Verrucomicrobiae bacterium]
MHQKDPQQRFQQFREYFSQWLFSHRGKATELASHLGVSRSNISSWFIQCFTRPPAWTIVPTLEFLARETERANFAPDYEHFHFRPVARADASNDQISAHGRIHYASLRNS